MAQAAGAALPPPERMGLSHAALDEPVDPEDEDPEERSRLVAGEGGAAPAVGTAGDIFSRFPDGFCAVAPVVAGLCAALVALSLPVERLRGQRRRAGASWLVLWDTEQTSWEGSNERRWRGFVPGTREPEHREIIQISALQVRFDPEHPPALRLGESMQVLVRPRVHPVLSDYVINLTNISQARVDREGVPLEEALGRLHALGTGSGRGAARRRAGAPGCGPAFLSWGNDWDVVEENLQLYGAAAPGGDRPGWGACMHDVRPLFSAAGLNLTGHTSGSIHRALNLSTAGHVHDSLWDCMSLFLTLREVVARGGSRSALVVQLLRKLVGA